MKEDFAPGMRAIIRDEEWMIRKVEKNDMGNHVLYCLGISPLVRDREEVFLSDLEAVALVNPAEIRLIPDLSPFFRRSQLYIESKWRQRIPTDVRLHIADRAAMDLMPYQMEPALLSLRRPRHRILIADAVGLGKTLEAGILISELIERGMGKRILVVTVKSMMAQFQKEFWNRFTIPLVRLDSKKIHDLRIQLPSNYNPFFYYDKTIVSIDTLKRDIEYRTHLENAWWDIIVIDEAQNVAERGGRQAQRSRLASLLAGRSDTMIMLSATPHDGRARSFASLMNMLDPTAIANPDDYTQEDIQGLCIRRFKKDVKDQISGSFQERRMEVQRCPASVREEQAFEIFAGLRLDMDLNRPQGAGQLFKTSLEKSLFSSPAACIKSIDARLSRLRKKYGNAEIRDIHALETLREALTLIRPEDFSRYQALLRLLRSPAYGWTVITDRGMNSGKDDRLVIFTERIETMRFLAEQLRADLGLKENAVQTLCGSMSDVEQQEIVENFGREEAPIRILVASDVASEGLNLHYLSHRMIHFDIPWSLMVFQQRNGRIDRYGQKQRPDIRYLLIESANKRIHGDMRILEILVAKEEQALKNIGDPAVLMGKFSVEEEEAAVAEAIEGGADADAFSAMLDNGAAAFDPFEALMEAAGAGAGMEAAGAGMEAVGAGAVVEVREEAAAEHEETLYRDLDYLYRAMEYLNQKDRHPVSKLETVSGLEITVTPDLRRRLQSLLPEEAMPAGDYLCLSDDKQFCMAEMRRSMRSSLENNAWPQTQYLWKLHPIFSWVNDKAGLLFGRGEAPLLILPDRLHAGEYLFLTAGSFPNRKSAPLVDAWFALRYADGVFTGTLSMEEAVQAAGLRRERIPNPGLAADTAVRDASALLPDAIRQAEKVLDGYFQAYQDHMNPLIAAEKNKLTELETRHKNYQLSLFDNERKRGEQERKVTDLFDTFTRWVHDTLEIQKPPYIRVIAVLTGIS